jgi:hypothetical protein
MVVLVIGSYSITNGNTDDTAAIQFKYGEDGTWFSAPDGYSQTINGVFQAQIELDLLGDTQLYFKLVSLSYGEMISDDTVTPLQVTADGQTYAYDIEFIYTAPPVTGCTNNNACNYNSEAEEDDELCEYPNVNCYLDDDSDGLGDDYNPYGGNPVCDLTYDGQNTTGNVEYGCPNGYVDDNTDSDDSVYLNAPTFTSVPPDLTESSSLTIPYNESTYSSDIYLGWSFEDIEDVNTTLTYSITGPGEPVTGTGQMATYTIDANTLGGGDYEVTITVTDSNGNSTSDTVYITINQDANVAPVITQLTDDPSQILPYNSSATSNTVEGVVRWLVENQEGDDFNWVFVKNSDSSEIGSGNNVAAGSEIEATIPVGDAGLNQYQAYTLTVTDTVGSLTDTENVNFGVSRETNTSPAAQIEIDGITYGYSQTVDIAIPYGQTSTSVTLTDASVDTTSAYGDTYEWCDVTNQSIAADCVTANLIDTTTSAGSSITPTIYDGDKIRLRFISDAGNANYTQTDSIILTFNVVSAGNTAPDAIIQVTDSDSINETFSSDGTLSTIDIAHDFDPLTGKTLTLTSIGTDSTPSTLSYQWGVGDDENYSSDESFSYVFLDGTTTVTLTISDGESASSIRTINIVVNEPNAAPEIQSTDVVCSNGYPGAESICVVGDDGYIDVTITPGATDVDSDTLTHSWTNNFDGGEVSTSDILELTDLTVAGYSYEYTVTDSYGLTDTQNYTFVVQSQSHITYCPDENAINYEVGVGDNIIADESVCDYGEGPEISTVFGDTQIIYEDAVAGSISFTFVDTENQNCDEYNLSYEYGGGYLSNFSFNEDLDNQQPCGHVFSFDVSNVPEDGVSEEITIIVTDINGNSDEQIFNVIIVGDISDIPQLTSGTIQWFETLDILEDDDVRETTLVARSFDDSIINFVIYGEYDDKLIIDYQNYPAQNVDSYYEATADFSIEPVEDWCGSVTLNVDLHDSDANLLPTTPDYYPTTSYEYVINVECQDDTPTVANPGTVNLEEGFGTHTLELQLTDPDVEFGGHTYSSIGIQINGAVLGNDIIAYDSETGYSISDDGILTFNLIQVGDDENFGYDWVEVTVTDPNGNDMFSTMTFNVNVSPINDSPVVQPIDDVELNPGDEITFSVTATDVEGNNTIEKFQLSFSSSINNSNWTDVTTTATLDGGGLGLSIAATNTSDGNLELTITTYDNSTFNGSVYVRACDDSGAANACSVATSFNVSVIDIYTGLTFNFDSDDALEIPQSADVDGVNLGEYVEFYGALTIDQGLDQPGYSDISTRIYVDSEEVTDVVGFNNYDYNVQLSNHAIIYIKSDKGPGVYSGSDLTGLSQTRHRIFAASYLDVTLTENQSHTVTIEYYDNRDNFDFSSQDSITITIQALDCNGEILWDGDSYAEGVVFPDECGDCDGSCEDMGGGYIACNDSGGGSADCAGNCGDNALGYQIGDDFSNLVANPNASNWDPTILASTNNGTYGVNSYNLEFFSSNQTVSSSSVNYYNNHFNDNPVFLIYIQKYLESIHYIDYYTETVNSSEPYYSYANEMLYTNGDVEDRFQCCPEGTDVVTCCLDLDNTGYCDPDIEYTTLPTGGEAEANPFISALTFTNGDGLLDFCGNCPDEDGWVEVAEPDEFGCMNPDALNYNTDANVPCNLAGDGSTTIEGDLFGECCDYLEGGFRVEVAPAFGISDSSRNIYVRGADVRPTFQNYDNLSWGYTNINQYGLMHPDFVAPYIFEDTNADPNLPNISTEEYPNVHLRVQPWLYELIIINGNGDIIYTKIWERENQNSDDYDPQGFENFVKGNFIYNFVESGNYRFEIRAKFYWMYGSYLSDSDSNLREITLYHPSGNQTGTEQGGYEEISITPIFQSIGRTLPLITTPANIAPYQGIATDGTGNSSNPVFNNNANAWDNHQSNEGIDLRKPLGCFNYNDENQLNERWPFDKLGESFLELPLDEITIELNEDESVSEESVNTFNNDTEFWKLPHVVDADVRMYKRRGISQSTLYYYWDKIEHTDNYDETVAPLDVQFYFYPRPSKNENGDELSLYDYKDENLLMDDFRDGYYYLAMVDWGDGSSREYDTEPLKLGYNVIARHNYERAGIYEINGYMMRLDLDKDFKPVGVISNTKFLIRININPERENEFEYLGGTGYSFIPYQNTTPIIGGISQNSLYYNSISRQLGFLEQGDITTYFEKYSDRLNSENALYLTNENQTGEEIIKYQDSVSDDGEVIFNGLYNKAGELGSSIGFTDIQIPRYFNEPIPMYELLGFDSCTCHDIDACNDNVNGPCWYANEGCTCEDPEGYIVDCAGVCGGSAVLDCAGECSGSAVFDCAGLCGGNAVIDECGECNGDGLSCDGGCNDVDACNYHNDTEDCSAVDGGSDKSCCTYEDCAGICGGETEIDCAGVCGGDAVGDECVDCWDMCNPNSCCYDSTLYNPDETYVWDWPVAINQPEILSGNCGGCGTMAFFGCQDPSLCSEPSPIWFAGDCQPTEEIEHLVNSYIGNQLLNTECPVSTLDSQPLTESSLFTCDDDWHVLELNFSTGCVDEPATTPETGLIMWWKCSCPDVTASISSLSTIDDYYCPGNPDKPEYWKNIIPEDYDIYTDRYGKEGEEQLSLDILLTVAGVLGAPLDETSLENQLIFYELCPDTGCDEFWLGLIENTITDFIDSAEIYNTISSEENFPYYDEDGDGSINLTDILAKVQKLKGGNFGEGNWNVTNAQSWVGDYYYPVIPKFNTNGSFSDDLGNKIPFGTSGRKWDGDDESAAITNEQYQDNSLIINYTSEYLDKGVLEDTSGYDNIGMCMNDYRLEYDEETIQPIKKNRKFKLNRGKTNKAF